MKAPVIGKVRLASGSRKIENRRLEYALYAPGSTNQDSVPRTDGILESGLLRDPPENQLSAEPCFKGLRRSRARSMTSEGGKDSLC